MGYTSISIKYALLILCFFNVNSLWWWTGLSCLDVYLLDALLIHLASWICLWLLLSVALSWFLRWLVWQVFPVFCLFQFYLDISLDYVSVFFKIHLRFRHFTFSIKYNVIIFVFPPPLQSQLFKYLSFQFTHMMYLNLGTLRLFFIFVKNVGYETLLCYWYSTRIGMTFAISGMFTMT